jgi:DNA gyrase subunit B
MYIGNPDARGLETCFMEVLALAVNEFCLGFGKRIDVCLHDDGSISITDNGRGLETHNDPECNRPVAELRLGTLSHGLGQFVNPALGLSGVGANCVNAVSESMRVEIKNAQGSFSISFARGEVVTPLTVVSEIPAEQSGLSVRFKPDPEIFWVMVFDYARLAWRCEETCFLCPGLVIAISDERPSENVHRLQNIFYFPQGIRDFVQHRLDPFELAHQKPIVFAKSEGETTVEAAFQFCSSDQRLVLSYMNFWPVVRGGTHVEGFLAGIRSCMEASFQRKPPSWVDRIDREKFDRGFVAVLKIDHPNPKFHGAWKHRVINDELFDVVRRLAEEGMNQFLAENPSDEEFLIHSFYQLDERRHH